MNVYLRRVLIIMTACICTEVGADTSGWYVKKLVLRGDNGYEKVSYTYNIDGKPINIDISQSSDGKAWSEREHIQYTYDHGLLLNKKIYKRGNGRLELESESKYGYFGHQLQSIYEKRNGESLEWEKKYDAETLLPEYESSIIKREAVSYESSVSFEYDSHRRLIELEHYLAAYEGGGAVYRVRFHYSDMIDSVISYSKSERGEWQPERKVEYKYSGESKKTEVHKLYLSGEWINESKAVYENEDGEQSLTTYYVWNTQVWRPMYRRVGDFDEEGNEIGCHVSYFKNNQWRLAYSFIESEDTDGSDITYHRENRSEFWAEEELRDELMTLPFNLSGRYRSAKEYWALGAEGVVVPEENEGNVAVSIYPNPSPSGLFYIEGLGTEIISFEVYDISGVSVMREDMPYGVVDLSGMPKGMYLIKVYHSSGSIAQKLIIN